MFPDISVVGISGFFHLHSNRRDKMLILVRRSTKTRIYRYIIPIKVLGGSGPT